MTEANDYRGITKAPPLDSFKAIIRLWPDHSKLADDCGVLRQHVSGWYQRDSIPSWHWQAVITAAERRGFKGVTSELMTELASR